MFGSQRKRRNKAWRKGQDFGNDLQTTGRNWDQYKTDPGGRCSLWSKKNNDSDN